MTKSEPIAMYIDFIHDEKNGNYKLEGYLGGNSSFDKKTTSINVNGKSLPLTYVDRIQSQDGLEYQNPIKGSTFEITINCDLQKKNHIQAVVNGRRVPIRMNRFTGLPVLGWAYTIRNNIIFVSEAGGLYLQPYAQSRHIFLELRYLLRIIVNWRIGDALKRLRRAEGILSPIVVAKNSLVSLLTIVEAIVMVPRAIVLRLAYYARKPRRKKPIWIITDRVMSAGDNGEALFRYLQSVSDIPADIYFAISKKSPDFTRLKAVGNVIDQDSLKYKLLFLLSSKIISSQANIETTNPFLRQINHYVDLFEFDFVFLQHGIIRHDLSGWLNRFNRNISLFITSSKVEYNSILSNAYYYSERNVLLSGLPRFDLLESKPRNKLILAPTYRNNLVRLKTDKYGNRKYDAEFKKSSYFNFYNRFMNDERLKKALKEHDMAGEFYLHPIFIAQYNDYGQNEVFKVMDFPYDYKRAFKEGSMLVSDHSSVVFDFAYLKKPVLYAHFDIDTFFNGHTYTQSDFFSDTDDGFGVVCDDYESLVVETLELIRKNCVMPKKYQKRVDDYFYKTDKNNSKRVYNAILERL